MLTRPIGQNKDFRGSYAVRPLPGLRQGTSARLNLGPRAVPIDPTNPAQRPGR